MRTFIRRWAAVTMVLTTAAVHGATLEFSGHTWNVRATGYGGPGPNHWDEQHAWVDEAGALHLKLAIRHGRCHGAEVSTQAALGFGAYRFEVVGALNRLNKNVVLGLFNYPERAGLDGTNEIDIEFARWGRAANRPGNYTVWPAQKGYAYTTRSFPIAATSNVTTHHFTWAATEVAFESWEGGVAEASVRLAGWHFQPVQEARKRIPQRPHPVHLNLWCFRGWVPSDRREVEVVIRSFQFTPAAR